MLDQKKEIFTREELSLRTNEGVIEVCCREHSNPEESFKERSLGLGFHGLM